MTFPSSRLIIGAWAASIAVMLLFLSFQFKVTTDLTHFLPRGADLFEQLMVKQLKEGPSSRVLLISIEGKDPGKLASISTKLAKRLSNSEHFVYIANGNKNISSMNQTAVFKYRYLFSPAVVNERFTVSSLRAALKQRLSELSGPMAIIKKRTLASDPTAELNEVLMSWSRLKPPHRKYGVWFTKSGLQALLMVQTRAPAFDLDKQISVTSFIRKQFEVIDNSSSAQLVISGPAEFSITAHHNIKKEAWWLSVMASVLVFSFLIIIYRSLGVVLLIGLPLVTAVIFSVCAVNLVFGSIHGITLAFGITIIGVAVDYPIHVFSHRMKGESVNAAVKKIWPTLRLSVVTTVMGYTAMLLTGFTGLSQLAVFAISGLATAALVTRFVIPVLSEKIVLNNSNIAVVSGKLVEFTRRFRWLPVTGIVAGGIILVSGAFSVWENDIANLSPISEEQKRVDHELRSALGAEGINKVIMIYGRDSESVLSYSEKISSSLGQLVREGQISGYDSPSLYLPSQAVQIQRRNSIPDQAELKRRLLQASQSLPFKPGLFEPFLTDMRVTRAYSPVTPADLKDSALGLRVGSLLFPYQSGWAGLLPLHGVSDDGVIEKAISSSGSDSGDVEVRYLDLKNESNRLIRRYRDQAIMFGLLGGVAILMVLFIGLRSLSKISRVAIPVVAAIVVCAVILVMLGERLSVFHLVAMLLTAGLGLDYALFFNRSLLDSLEQTFTLQALLICNITTVLVFGLLATSDTPVLHSIGLTVSLGAVLSLVFAASMSRTSGIVPGSNGITMARPL